MILYDYKVSLENKLELFEVGDALVDAGGGSAIVWSVAERDIPISENFKITDILKIEEF